MKRNIPSKNAEVKGKCYIRNDQQCIPGKREPGSPQENFPLNVCFDKTKTRKKQLRSLPTNNPGGKQLSRGRVHC